MKNLTMLERDSVEMVLEAAVMDPSIPLADLNFTGKRKAAVRRAARKIWSGRRDRSVTVI